MKRMPLGGYTIIEVMMFLAVSGGLLLSAMIMISGQQRRTEFSTGMQEFNSRFQDVVNDVENGFYPSASDLKCTVTNMLTDANAVPTLTATATEQGTNEDCVFLGKAIEFYRDSSGELNHFRTVTITGKRLAYNTATSKPEEPEKIEDYKPTPFYVPSKGSGLEEFSINNGVEITDIKRVISYAATMPKPTISYDNSLESLAIVPGVAARTINFNSSSLSNGRAALAVIDGDASYSDSKTVLTTIPTISNASVTNADKGVAICMRDGAGGRPAVVAIGLQIDSSSGVDYIKPTGQRLASQVYFDDQAREFGCSA